MTTTENKRYKDIDHSLNYNSAIAAYIRNIRTMNKSTAEEYLSRLNNFENFVAKEYDSCLTINDLIAKIKKAMLDPYDIINGYAAYLRKCNITTSTLRQRIVTVKNFLEYCDVDITPRKFKLKVKLPKVVRKKKEALSKDDIVEILNVCDNIRLRTYVMLLAATGMRAVEALSIRIRDLDIDSNPATIFVRGEYSKTKVDRIVFLTEEVTQQLKSWLDYKYRTRRVCYQDKLKGKTITEYRTPDKINTDLVFAVYQDKKTPNPDYLYDDLGKSFAKTLDRSSKGNMEDGSLRRRQITLHSFRRFVKTTISDLGYADFSEWFIGHSGSTYWTKKDSEKAELFKKIEPYLTYLDYPALERKGADVQSKIDILEMENQRLRHNDKLKEDSLATLSDQVMKLMVEVQEFKKQQ